MGKLDRVGEQDRAAGAGQVRHAGQRAGALLELLDRGVERGRGPLAEARRPHGHRGPGLDLAARARSRRPRRSRSAPPARAPRGPPRAPPPAPRERPPDTNSTTRSQAAPSSSAAADDAASSAATRESSAVDRPVPMRTDMTRHDTPRSHRPRSPRPYWPADAGDRRLRADGRRQDRRGDRARQAAARARRGPGRGLRRRDAGLRGPPGPDRRGHAQPSRPSSSTGCSASFRSPRPSPPAPTPSARTARSTRCSSDGRRPIVVGGTGLYLRAALADLDLRPPVDPASGERLAERPIEQLHAELPKPWPPGSRPPTASESSAPTSCSKPATSPPPPANAPSELWTTHTRHPTLLAALVMDRDALADRIDQRVDAMIAGGAATRSSAAARGRCVRHRPPRARLPGAARRRHRGDEDPTRRYAKRQLTWLRKLPGAHLIDVTGPHARRTSPPS